MLKNTYASRYSNDKRVAIYPVEFVVRAFLGTYPELRMPKEYDDRHILDLGYGDGRNMPLLSNLGMKIWGVEISEDINRHVQDRLTKLGIQAELKVGTNAHIPYDDSFFQYVLACHSCYYVEPGDTFSDNIAEIARVLEPSGFFIASLPMLDTYILNGAKPLPDSHFEITNDPYGLRNGIVFRAFSTEYEIRETLAPFFTDFSIGYCNDMFWGIHQKVWTVVCRKE